MGPPGTIGTCICPQETGTGRPGDPQQPTSGAHAGESTGTLHQPPPTTMDADTHGSAVEDPGPDTQAPPAASPGTADTAGEAPCPQASCQPEAETCAVRAPGGTGRTDTGGQGTTCTTNYPAAVLHKEPAEGAADDTHPSQSAAAEECVQPGAATSLARVRTHENPWPGAPDTEDILATIFNAVARTADQGLQTDEHLQDDESFAAFMASCRDGAPTTGPATTSALRHVTHDRRPTSPARDPASASHQAHLRCNHAALGSAAETHPTTAGDCHAGGQPEEGTSHRPRAQDAPARGVRAPAATGIISGPVEGIPPRMTRPW